MSSYIRQIFTLSAHQKPTVGDTKFSVVPTDHMGWLQCDGRSLAVSSYVFLYNVIGYSYGGSAMTSTFNLPNPAGRVPAAVGRGTDANTSSFTVALGSTIGEYVHQLSIAEMPSHNHGVAGGGQISTNNSTSMVSTGITLTDPGHAHSYNVPNPVQPALGSPGSVGVGTVGATTGSNFTGITLNDPTHSHVINPAGGDRAHNNVQPTIGMGNMFIYSGKVNLGSFPYTTGTLLY
jgi:microcystin-dependent protein